MEFSEFSKEAYYGRLGGYIMCLQATDLSLVCIEKQSVQRLLGMNMNIEFYYISAILIVL